MILRALYLLIWVQTKSFEFSWGGLGQIKMCIQGDSNSGLMDKWPGQPSRRHSEFFVKPPESMITGYGLINSRSRASYVDEEKTKVQFWRSKGNSDTSIVHEERKRAYFRFKIFGHFCEFFEILKSVTGGSHSTPPLDRITTFVSEIKF